MHSPCYFRRFVAVFDDRSVSRSRLVSSSTLANAAMIVNNIGPTGVELSPAVPRVSQLTMNTANEASTCDT